MDFIELAKKRFSVRGYLDKDVDDSQVLEIMEAARWAPFACNNQPWSFIVIRSAEFKLRLQAVYNSTWFLSAPVIIVACCDRNQSWKRADGKDYGDVDIAIVMDHLTLAAAEKGLGTCWIGSFKYRETCEALKLPENIDPVALTPLGYPSMEKPVKARKEISQIIYWNYFGGGKKSMRFSGLYGNYQDKDSVR